MNQPLAGFRPPTQIPWSPARGRSLAQAAADAAAVAPVERRFMNFDDPAIRDFAVSNGVAIGYGIVASLLYGRGQLLNRALLGLGAAAFGYASYTGFKVGLQASPTKTTPDYVLGNVMGTMDGLLAIGAALGAISPKAAISRRSGTEVVIAAVPV